MFVQADNVEALIRTICQAAGSDEREADMVARNLTRANLTGHDSHGVGMIPTYIPTALRGEMAVGQHVSVVSDNGPIVVLDGNMAYGHRPLVAPYGGTDARYTTNPYCTAFPATDNTPQMILDMATSRIAMGKVRVAFNQGVEVPPDALIGPNGAPTRDPGVMFREPYGAMLSIGLHKGYGLALVCELLAGGLTGGGTFLPSRVSRNTIVNNMLTIIIDPAAAGDAAAFAREIDELTAHVKRSPPAEGVDEVMVPGDPERKSSAERGANGIPIDDRTWQELVETAATVGISADEMDRLAAA